MPGEPGITVSSTRREEMQQQPTKIYKNAYGWAAETEILLGDKLVLTLLTMKRSNGRIETTAKVEKLEGQFKVYTMGDYSIRLISVEGRCTEKWVQGQQQRALTDYIPNVLKDVAEKYNLQPLPL
jgi:hypothetical protein